MVSSVRKFVSHKEEIVSHNRNNKFFLGVAILCFMFMAITITGTVVAQEDTTTYSCLGADALTVNTPAGTGGTCTRQATYTAAGGVLCRDGYSLDEGGNNCVLDPNTSATYDAFVMVRAWVCETANTGLVATTPTTVIDEDNPLNCEGKDYDASQADIDREDCVDGWTFRPAVVEVLDEIGEVETAGVAAFCEATAVTPYPAVIRVMMSGGAGASTPWVWTGVQGNDMIGHPAAPVRLFGVGSSVQIFYADGNQGIYATTISANSGSFSATNPVNGQPVSVTTSAGNVSLRTAYDDGKAYDIDISSSGAVTIINW